MKIGEPNTQKDQQGVAAIEFALSISVLLVICFAIVSYGLLMWTQQRISHITGDSARVALQYSIHSPATYIDEARKHAKDLVGGDALLRDRKIDYVFTEKTCGDGEGSYSCLAFTMIVTINDLPLVNIVQVAGNFLKFFSKDINIKGWIPTELSATSTVKITDL